MLFELSEMNNDQISIPSELNHIKFLFSLFSSFSKLKFISI